MFKLLDWLIEEVTFGNDHDARMGLFKKLCRIHQQHHDAALRIIADVWARAKSIADRKHPGHYFAKTVKIRLLKAGLWVEKNQFAGLSGEELIREGFRSTQPMPLYDPPLNGQVPGHADKELPDLRTMRENCERAEAARQTLERDRLRSPRNAAPNRAESDPGIGHP